MTNAALSRQRPRAIQAARVMCTRTWVVVAVLKVEESLLLVHLMGYLGRLPSEPRTLAQHKRDSLSLVICRNKWIVTAAVHCVRQRFRLLIAAQASFRSLMFKKTCCELKLTCAATRSEFPNMKIACGTSQNLLSTVSRARSAISHSQSSCVRELLPPGSYTRR